jgi:hypothetical protein
VISVGELKELRTELLPIIGCRHKQNAEGFIQDLNRVGNIVVLLGNDRETNNETVAIARQQLRKCATVLHRSARKNGSHTE